MNEGRTTAIFATVAAVSFGLAIWSRPSVVIDESDLVGERVGSMVFPKFEDPATAASFQIVKYDENLGQLERFEIAKDPASNLWKIPSYDDYPADATEQVRDATTPLIGLQILTVASADRGDHSLYGVVDPDQEDLSVSESGVGMLVRVQDAEDQVLASLIVGKEVEQAENQRYVRVKSEDPVYVVELDTTPFTTEFKKWIDDKLLDVRSFDITSVGLRDYAVLPVQGGYGLDKKFDADLAYDASSSKWSLDRFVVYDGKEGVESQLAEGEEIQQTALNDLRNAIQDLAIVGVRRKPAGLAANLKADKSLVENQESITSLLSQGFFPQERVGGIELLATGGETLVGTDEGVQYLLRFGESESSLADVDDEDDNGLRRYLLVMAQVDDSKFPAPELEPQPETVEEMLAMRKAQETSDAPADEAEVTPDAPPSEEASPTDPAPEATADAPEVSSASENNGSEEAAETDAAGDSQQSKNEDVPTAAEGDNETPADTTPAPADTEAANANSESSETAEESAGAPADEDVTAPETAAVPASDPPASESETDATSAAPTQEELEEELQAVREKINKENQRKIDERNESRDAALKKVQELNARFADWYYVVSDSVYKKLKISRDQLIKSAEAAPEATGPDFGNGFPGLGELPGPGGLPPGLNFGNENN
ncbi:MAG: DUF4340 domain-containing protein [Planctomycetales bacterium]|nr:DUF4340 domain-containing protein [Planctomycetales bacterium]